MNRILLQKQKPIFITTKSLNQYTNTKAQTPDEIQALENYENNDEIVVFDDMLKQESNIDLFFLEVDIKILIYTTRYQSYCHLPKILFLKILIEIFHLNKL